MSPLLKNLLIALGFAVLLWVAYRFFFSEEEVLLSPEHDAAIVAASGESQKLLRSIRQLRAIELEAGLFEDARFRTLVDHRLELSDEPVGRQNPLAPIGR